METLASGNAAPANADNTAQSDATDADAKVENETGDGSAPSVPEADTPAPKKDAVQERIDKLTREKYDALRERDRRDYELERVNARLKELETAKTPEIAPQNDFPTLEQFGYDEPKFQAAVAAHIAKVTREQGTAAAQEVIRAERDAERQRKAGESWATKEAEFIKSKPDYVDKVRNAPTLPISQELQAALQGSPLGPQIAYHLVENADAAREIMRLPLPLQLMEAGRIAARIESAKAAPKPAVSQAPPPPNKVDGTAAVTGISSTDPDSYKLSDDEWVRAEKARLARKARRQTQ